MSFQTCYVKYVQSFRNWLYTVNNNT